MAKKFPPCRCVHCLEHCDDPTSDHVFPQSWYPETTPENLEKWQVPSCNKCNSEYSKIEDDLLQRFGMCVDPRGYAARGIADKALRAVNPDHGRDERDKEHRFHTRLKILKNLIPHDSINYKALLPSKGPLPSYEGQIGVLIPGESLKRMGEKFIRGITFVVDNLYIEKDHRIDLFFVHEINAREIVNLLQQHGKIYNSGPGIVIERAHVPGDLQSGLYFIEIWNKLYMYGTVTPRTEE